MTDADRLWVAGLPVEGQDPLAGLAQREPEISTNSLPLFPPRPEPNLPDGFQFTIHAEELDGEDALNFVPRRL